MGRHSNIVYKNKNVIKTTSISGKQDETQCKRMTSVERFISL